MKIKIEATIEDLYKVSGKAELKDGEIVYVAPTGYFPGRAGFRIVKSLDDYILSRKQHWMFVPIILRRRLYRSWFR